MRNGGAGLPCEAASARGRSALAAAVLLAAMLPGIGPASAEVVFTFEGGGYGHAVGMSQYGAYGMSREGYTWEEILTHYFTGASPADVDPALLAEPIWVGLAQEQARLSLTVTPTGAAPAAPVTVTVGGTAIVVNGGETIVVEPLAGGRCRVSAPAGSAEGLCAIDAVWDGGEEQPTTAVQLDGCRLPDWNVPGGTVWKPCRYARGNLHIRPDNDTATLHLSLEIDVEDYVLGISESPYSWGTTGGQAALEAQAVAARSYALHRVVMRGDPAARPWCWCQLYDTTVDQFYAGWGHGTQPWLDAVAATAGKVMTHPAETRNGALIPIQTFYSSSTFGWTEDSENGFTAYVPYLRAVDDHWSLLPEVGNPKARWSRSFTADRLAALLPGLSTVSGATVTRCSPTGAALEITFTGNGGNRAFSTRDLRSRLGLPSMQVVEVGAPPSGSPACRGYALSPLEPGGPAALAGVTIDDDAVEDSAGNGDGTVQCGEKVEVSTTLTNQGADLRMVTATLSSTDPHVSILWNTTSAFPNLPAGGAGANLNDWDLAVSADAPDGHTAHLALRVSAENGGPWQLDVPLPVACGAPLVGVVADPGDTNGDGRSEVAVAFARAGQPARLQVRDGTTGSILSTLTLARAGYTPIAAVTLPSFAGSPAAELAILLALPGGPGRVVVVDGTGQRIKAFGLKGAATYLDLAAFSSSAGPAAPRLAVLSVRPGGLVRVLVRDAATGVALAGVGFGTDLAPAALAVAPAFDGGAVLAVLGNGGDGGLQAPLRRAADGAAVRALPLAADVAATDLVSLPGPDGRFLLVAVGTAAGGQVRLVTSDPATGSIVASYPVAGMSSVHDLEALADLGGGSGHDVAVLGRAADGTDLAMVIDPVAGTVLATHRLPVGYPTADLASLLGGRGLAALGIGNAGTGLVTVRHAAAGEAASSFAAP